MPVISNRAVEMPKSPIRKLVPLADAAKRRGTKIYHLNIGQPDLSSPQEAMEVLRNIDIDVLAYSPSDGFLSLREKLVGYYDQYQIKLSPDDIIITTGGSEAVLFAFMPPVLPPVPGSPGPEGSSTAPESHRRSRSTGPRRHRPPAHKESN